MHRIARFLLLLPALLLCTGCSISGTIWENYHDIEQMQLVQTLGIDDDAAGVRLSVSGGLAGAGPPPLLLTEAAPTLQLAMQQLRSAADGGDLFFAHTRYLLLGEGAARAGIAPYLDFVERDAAMRLSVPAFLLTAENASGAVLDADVEKKTDVTVRLQAAEREAGKQGGSHAFTCGEIAQSLARSGSALVCAVERDAGGALLPCGYAVLRGAKLAGFLTGGAACGTNLLLQLGGHARLALPDGTGLAGITIEHSRAAFSPVWSDDGSLARVDVSVSVRAVLTELTEPHRILDADYLDRLGRTLAGTVTGWVQAALTQSQALDADFLELGQQLFLQSPHRWQAAAEQQPPALSEMTFRIAAEAAVERASELQNAADVTGGAP